VFERLNVHHPDKTQPRRQVARASAKFWLPALVFKSISKYGLLRVQNAYRRGRFVAVKQVLRRLGFRTRQARRFAAITLAGIPGCTTACHSAGHSGVTPLPPQRLVQHRNRTHWCGLIERIIPSASESYSRTPARRDRADGFYRHRAIQPCLSQLGVLVRWISAIYKLPGQT
jgi:hypothetical protein